MIDPRLLDVILPENTGYPYDIAKLDTREAMMGAVEEAGAIITEFPSHLWIEPRDWKIRSEANDANRTWPCDYIDRFTNQGEGNGGYSTHECTCHALRCAFEAARNRARQIAVGPPVPRKRLETSAKSASVWVSPLSVYAEANPGQWGGAGCRQVLKIAAQRGFLPDKLQPREYNFKHTLHGTCGAGGVNQSRGPWTPVSRFPEGWKETARHFRPIEFIFPDSWEQTVCLVLHGFVVGVGRDGHSVPYDKWMADDDVMRYIDSYDIFRYDSINRIRSTVGGSYAIVTTTIPDDWDHPGQ